MENKWNERYADATFAYGEQPNAYLKAQLDKLPAGRILFPADGEGRNSVYAATRGWTATAFDLSIEGYKKAQQLATKHNTKIDYAVGDFESLEYAEEEFDAIALIYAHFPGDKKSAYHQRLVSYLKPGGIVIFEAFSKSHLEFVRRNEQVGGPKDPDMLFSETEIKANFIGFEHLELAETVIELNEGLYHRGMGSVIRFVGRKR